MADEDLSKWRCLRCGQSEINWDARDLEAETKQTGEN